MRKSECHVDAGPPGKDDGRSGGRDAERQTRGRSSGRREEESPPNHRSSTDRSAGAGSSRLRNAERSASGGSLRLRSAERSAGAGSSRLRSAERTPGPSSLRGSKEGAHGSGDANKGSEKRGISGRGGADYTSPGLQSAPSTDIVSFEQFLASRSDDLSFGRDQAQPSTLDAAPPSVAHTKDPSGRDQSPRLPSSPSPAQPEKKHPESSPAQEEKQSADRPADQKIPEASAVKTPDLLEPKALPGLPDSASLVPAWLGASMAASVPEAKPPTGTWLGASLAASVSVPEAKPLTDTNSDLKLAPTSEAKPSLPDGTSTDSNPNPKPQIVSYSISKPSLAPDKPSQTKPSLAPDTPSQAKPSPASDTKPDLPAAAAKPYVQGATTTASTSKSQPGSLSTPKPAASYAPEAKLDLLGGPKSTPLSQKDSNPEGIEVAVRLETSRGARALGPLSPPPTSPSTPLLPAALHQPSLFQLLATTGPSRPTSFQPLAATSPSCRQNPDKGPASASTHAPSPASANISSLKSPMDAFRMKQVSEQLTLLRPSQAGSGAKPPGKQGGAEGAKPTVVELLGVGLNPLQPICMFDVRGSCKDPSCGMQHQRTGDRIGAKAVAQEVLLRLQACIDAYTPDEAPLIKLTDPGRAQGSPAPVVPPVSGGLRTQAIKAKAALAKALNAKNPNPNQSQDEAVLAALAVSGTHLQAVCVDEGLARAAKLCSAQRRQAWAALGEAPGKTLDAARYSHLDADVPQYHAVLPDGPMVAHEPAFTSIFLSSVSVPESKRRPRLPMDGAPLLGLDWLDTAPGVASLSDGPAPRLQKPRPSGARTGRYFPTKPEPPKSSARLESTPPLGPDAARGSGNAGPSCAAEPMDVDPPHEGVPGGPEEGPMDADACVQRARKLMEAVQDLSVSNSSSSIKEQADVARKEAMAEIKRGLSLHPHCTRLHCFQLFLTASTYGISSHLDSARSQALDALCSCQQLSLPQGGLSPPPAAPPARGAAPHKTGGAGPSWTGGQGGQQLPEPTLLLQESIISVALSGPVGLASSLPEASASDPVKPQSPDKDPATVGLALSPLIEMNSQASPKQNQTPVGLASTSLDWGSPTKVSVVPKRVPVVPDEGQVHAETIPECKAAGGKVQDVAAFWSARTAYILDLLLRLLQVWSSANSGKTVGKWVRMLTEEQSLFSSSYIASWADASLDPKSDSLGMHPVHQQLHWPSEAGPRPSTTDLDPIAESALRQLLLACLQGNPEEVWVLWASCAQLVSVGTLPNDVICRLGYPQQAVVLKAPPKLDAALRAMMTIEAAAVLVGMSCMASASATCPPSSRQGAARAITCMAETALHLSLAIDGFVTNTTSAQLPVAYEEERLRLMQKPLMLRMLPSKALARLSPARAMTLLGPRYASDMCQPGSLADAGMPPSDQLPPLGVIRLGDWAVSLFHEALLSEDPPDPLFGDPPRAPACAWDDLLAAVPTPSVPQWLWLALAKSAGQGVSGGPTPAMGGVGPELLSILSSLAGDEQQQMGATHIEEATKHAREGLIVW
eukprot:gene16946-23221_t